MVVKTIELYLSEDHRVLERVFREFQAEKRLDLEKAKTAFENFTSGLLRHIAWEEEILFPVFEDKTSLKDIGPTVEMRREHQKIRQILGAIRGKIEKGNSGSDRDEDFLLGILRGHRKKEEDVIFPLLDELTTFSEREDIFLAMKNLSRVDAKPAAQKSGQETVSR